MKASESLYHYKGIITSVYDGDSVKADLDYGFSLIRQNVSLRLMGVDTPEKRKGTPAERAAGRHVQRLLDDVITGKEVIVQSVAKPDKYGRSLSVVYLDDKEVNKWLIDEGLAKPYLGGTKKPYTDDESRAVCLKVPVWTS